MVDLPNHLAPAVVIKGCSPVEPDVETADLDSELAIFERNTMYVPELVNPGFVTRAENTRRKVDIWLLPLLGMLYALALIDRTNLGVARIAGMNTDLVCHFSPALNLF